MKIKKISLSIIASLGLILAAGCGESASPEDVAQGYMEALVAGDLTKANKLSSEKTATMNGLFISLIAQEKEQNPEKFKNLDKVERVEIDGDKARVYFGENGAVDLVKVDGEWKVDIRK